MPTEAAELWIMPVNPAPTSTPRIGLWKAVSISWNFGEFASGDTESDISDIPVIMIAKPTRIRPISLCLFFFAPIISITPMIATIGANEVGLSIFTNGFFPSTPARLSIQAVSVVPMSEPKHTPTVCSSDISPELTKPTSITVIADDDCIAIVTTIPSMIAINLFEVIFLSATSSLPPVSFSRPVDITFIP